jgi:hypothetical protein
MNALRDPSISYAFFYGGSSSSKTYSIVQALLIEMLIDGKDTIVFKKTRAAITASIYKDCVAAIKQMCLEPYFEILQNSIRCKNGSQITFAGIEDPERIKGIAGFKRIVFDEITEADMDDFKQLTVRMRGIENQTFIGIFNPVDEQHWIKKELFDKLDLRLIENTINGNPDSRVLDVYRKDRYIIVRSSYLNNYYVNGSIDGTWGYRDEAAIARFDEMKNVDYNYYRIYALAEWGKVSEGGEFYKNFKRTIHVGSFDIDESLPLHISVDENLRPFSPMIVAQIEYNTIKIVDEIIGESPNNNFISVVKMFAAKYGNFRNNKIFLYGDATSRKGDSRSEQGFNLFMLIKTELEMLGFQSITIRINNANPSVAISGVFMNNILAGIQSHSLLINSNCHHAINDFLYLKENAEGGALKEMYKDKDGFRCEKYGHVSDAVRYLVVKYLEAEFKKFNIKGHTEYVEDNLLASDLPDFLQF